MIVLVSAVWELIPISYGGTRARLAATIFGLSFGLHHAALLQSIRVRFNVPITILEVGRPTSDISMNWVMLVDDVDSLSLQ